MIENKRFSSGPRDFFLIYQALNNMRRTECFLRRTVGTTVDLARYIGYKMRMKKGTNEMAFVIFDLDGTVIDSDHRALNKPCGSIDLAHWRANCTPEKIANDTLLPLARSMRKLYDAGHTIIVCTSRIMSGADFDFLRNNNLPFHVALHRDECDERPCGEMKVAYLQEYLLAHTGKGIRENNCIMFEDNLGVINAMMKEDVLCFDAKRANAKLKVA